MVISSGEKPLTELIRELIRQELKRGETTSKGGNTLITSEKDLHLVTRGTHKAYYNGVEIGSSGAVTSVFGRTGAVTALDSDYVNFLLLNGTRAMVGDLTFKQDPSAAIYLKNAAGTSTYASIIAGSTSFSLLAALGNLVLTAQTSGKTIMFDTLSGTRLTISDTSITTAVGLMLGGDLYGAGGVYSLLDINDLWFYSAATLAINTSAAGVAGNSLIARAGNSGAGTDLAGGDVTISSGSSTGAGYSRMFLKVPTPGTTGTTARTATTYITLGVGYVDFSVPIDMYAHKIEGVADPESAQDAATKNYVDTLTGVYLPLAGGTMAGAIAMGTYGITGTGDVTPHDDGTHKCGTAANTWGEVWGLYFQGADATDYISFSAAGTIDIRTNGLSRLAITDTAITAAVPLSMTGDLTFKQDPSAAIYLKNAAGTSTYASLIAGSTTVSLLAALGNLSLTAQTSGKTITFDTLSGTRLTIADSLITTTVPLTVGGTLKTGADIEVNANGTGNRYAYIDFHGDDTYTDYGLRLIRSNVGANSDSTLTHRGTGNLNFEVIEAGGILFFTNSSYRMGINSAGHLYMNNNPITYVPSISAPPASSLTLKVSAGQSIIFQTV